MAEGEGGMPEPVTFTVVMYPRKAYADSVYLGNLLFEALQVISARTGAFTFEVKREGGEAV